MRKTAHIDGFGFHHKRLIYRRYRCASELSFSHFLVLFIFETRRYIYVIMNYENVPEVDK